MIVHTRREAESLSCDVVRTDRRIAIREVATAVSRPQVVQRWSKAGFGGALNIEAYASATSGGKLSFSSGAKPIANPLSLMLLRPLTKGSSIRLGIGGELKRESLCPGRTFPRQLRKRVDQVVTAESKQSNERRRQRATVVKEIVNRIGDIKLVDRERRGRRAWWGWRELGGTRSAVMFSTAALPG